MADLILHGIDRGQGFDFGRTSADYARYRDIYPATLYRKLREFGIVRPGERILDVGTGTGVLPRNLYDAGAKWTGADLSEEQISMARKLSQGMEIDYVAAPAERLPVPDRSFELMTACQCFWYFDIPAFLAELRRVVVPGGRFCKIIMNWLPHESGIAAETEKLVLQYNPAWSGGGYVPEPFAVPDWTAGVLEPETFHHYREGLPFSIDSWCGRIRACRGVGASLSAPEVKQFDRALRESLERNGEESFEIPHYIRIEVYRLIGPR